MEDGSRIEIAAHLNGPARSGQGGYSCGLFAAQVPEPAQVTLRRPVPLSEPLSVERLGPDAVAVKHGEALIAEAASLSLEIVVPPPVGLDEAREARERYRGTDEIFRHCFVCGQREDSQRVFAGPVAGREVVATPWTPEAEWLARDGIVLPEFVWAVLDCPTYFAAELRKPGLLAMLGRLSARLLEPVPAGEPHVVMAWPISDRRRKHEAGCAIFSEDGRLRAAARAIQIEVSGVADPPG
ncbi:MAG: hypothetical protein ACXWZM_05490 [Solirubrobacterales bacterium]